MSTPSHTVLEEDIHFTWFGLVLWDSTAGSRASDGLDVRVWPLPLTANATPVTATANRRGIFVAHHLPQRTVTSPEPGYLVEVRDRLDRFTPFVMHVTTPTEPEYVRPRCAALLMPAQSPGTDQFQVPLFNMPSRTAAAGSAVVRASLVDAVDGKPAEFAVLEVSTGGHLVGRGIADQHGQAVVMFSYPEPEPAPQWSPPAPPTRPRPPVDQKWTVSATVRYRPPLPRYRLDPNQPALVDLCDVLEQPAARVATTSPSLPFDEPQLCYGEELILGGQGGLLITAS
jgi:hypothetical protein